MQLLKNPTQEADVPNSYKGYQMWNAEDRYIKQLKKHLNLTFCLNITLKVHEKDIFWAATIYSTSDPFLLIIHENYRFWYIATYMEYEIFKMSPPKRLNWPQMSGKWAGNIFSSFWPHFIYGAVKLSILMCHTTDFIWNF